MAIAKSVLGLQRALAIRTPDGFYEVDPSQDPQGYGDLLGQSHDARVQDFRATEDASPLPAGADPAQTAYFRTLNRAQEDGAMGPQGYNRQWAGFLEAPQVLAENNPGTTYRPSYGMSGSANVLASLAGRPKSMNPLPEGHEAFVARMVKKFGAR